MLFANDLQLRGLGRGVRLSLVRAHWRSVEDRVAGVISGADARIL
jgi:hypothetical protein